MKVLDHIEDMLCDELEEIAKKNDLSMNNLDIIDTAVDVLKDISVLRAMEEEYPSERGYSGRYNPIYNYDDGIPMQGRSYARGRTSNMRRNYNDNYSGDTKEELMRLMDTAKSDKEREAIRSALDHIAR